jgi:hypothetical protein
LLLLLVIDPLLIAAVANLPAIGYVSLAIAVAAPMIWGAHLNRMLGVLGALAIYFSLLTDSGIHWWVIDAAANWSAHAMIVVGVVLLAAWLYRLAHLREEMPDYHGAVPWRVARPSGGESSVQRSASANQVTRSPLIAWIIDIWLSGMPRALVVGDRRQFSRLLGYGFSPWPIELQAVALTLAIGGVTLFMTDFTSFGRQAGVGALNFYLFFATIMPGFQGGEWLDQRRPRVAVELFRPFSRPQLIDGLFVAILRNSIVYWLIMNFGILLAAWHVLGDRLKLEDIAMYAFLSSATTFATLGLALRIAVWPSQFIRLCFTLVMWMFMAPFVGWWLGRERYGDFPFVTLAVILAGIGKLLVANARKAWLNLELGWIRGL